jgi:hypothetical protein
MTIHTALMGQFMSRLSKQDPFVLCGTCPGEVSGRPREYARSVAWQQQRLELAGSAGRTVVDASAESRDT